MMMNISFLINIFMFVVSILSVSYLCVVRPENPLFYFLPAFLVVFYFKTIFAYREYFVVFIDAFNLQYDILKKISTMSDEEQESFDNLPEGLQQAERGQQMEAIANSLDDALSALDSAIDDVESAASEVENALEQ